jgi:hypothetical protein
MTNPMTDAPWSTWNRAPETITLASGEEVTVKSGDRVQIWHHPNFMIYVAHKPAKAPRTKKAAE